jgi:hypothetical protein
VDVNGWYPAGSDYQGINPVRILDTRPNGRKAAAAITEVTVAGQAGVAANASAVVVNLTALDAPQPGFVTAWPCGSPQPNSSNLNYVAGAPVANSAIVRIGTGGKICLFNDQAANLIVDVNGWYPAGSDYQGINPVRILDTRTTAAPVPTTAAPVPTTAAPVPAGSFVATFTGNVGLEQFNTGVFHRDDVLVSNTTWTGDHDLACGSPDTQRTIRRSNPSESFYLCKDHLMTSVGDTSGYSTAYFEPRQTFTGSSSVSWDVNVTDLMDRQWWEVAIVPASFNSGVATCPHCSVADWLSGTAHLPAYPAGSVVVGNGPVGGDLHIRTDGTEVVNPFGMAPICASGNPGMMDTEGCASKAIRRTFTVTDNGNGTVSVDAFGRRFTTDGRLPTEFRVVFKDHNYTPDKDGDPVGHTWHWDNIIVN